MNYESLFDAWNALPLTWDQGPSFLFVTCKDDQERSRSRLDIYQALCFEHALRGQNTIWTDGCRSSSFTLTTLLYSEEIRRTYVERTGFAIPFQLLHFDFTGSRDVTDVAKDVSSQIYRWERIFEAPDKALWQEVGAVVGEALAGSLGDSIFDHFFRVPQTRTLDLVTDVVEKAADTESTYKFATKPAELAGRIHKWSKSYERLGSAVTIEPTNRSLLDSMKVQCWENLLPVLTVIDAKVDQFDGEAFRSFFEVFFGIVAKLQVPMLVIWLSNDSRLATQLLKTIVHRDSDDARHSVQRFFEADDSSDAVRVITKPELGELARTYLDHTKRLKDSPPDTMDEALLCYGQFIRKLNSDLLRCKADGETERLLRDFKREVNMKACVITTDEAEFQIQRLRRFQCVA